MLDPKTIELIKATVPALKVHANAITEHFYPLLFKQHPEVIPYFNQNNQANGAQPRALANAVVAYGANIDALGNLSEAVTQIVQKHASLGILPEQYDAVGACLLQSIKAVLGDAATEEIIAAWGAAYGQLAGILIAAEESVYAQNEQKPGGWRGEREFKLAKRVNESSVITSFYFEPADGNAIPAFEAGQFITIILDDVEGTSIRRNYSLSDASGKPYFRISVKREKDGVASNHLHQNLKVDDTVKLLPPCGHFTLRKNEKPLVLLTGGVGITPAISMLNTEAESGREIRFIHAALNSQTHAFKEHVDELATKHDNISACYVYSEPTPQCQPHAEGLINQTLITSQLPEDKDVELYFVGPKAFMVEAFNISKALGLTEEQVHYEFFGPAEALTG